MKNIGRNGDHIKMYSDDCTGNYRRNYEYINECQFYEDVMLDICELAYSMLYHRDYVDAMMKLRVNIIKLSFNNDTCNEFIWNDDRLNDRKFEWKHNIKLRRGHHDGMTEDEVNEMHKNRKV